jgi:hypothetical protein
VSVEGSRLFLYAGSEDSARAAEQILSQVLVQRGLSADSVTFDRWHPVEEEWEDASLAEPRTPAERQEEHQRLEQEDTRESVASGYALWEVRAELPSHHEATELARRLRAEGRTVIRRWTLLVLGANDEDDANALAEVVKGEAPADATVSTQEIGPLLPFVGIGPLAV